MNITVLKMLRTCACFGIAITMLGLTSNAATAQPNPAGNTVVEILPVSVNTGAGVITGDTVELTAGGVIVEFQIRVSDWAATGDGVLLSVQAQIDDTSYCSGIGDPLYPVGYPGAPVLSCPQGNGCAIDGTTCDQGGFIATQVCTENAMITGFGAPCSGGFPSCPAGEFCVDNPDYVFNAYNPIPVIQFAGLKYIFASVSQLANGRPDATCVGGALDGQPCGPLGECLTGTCTGLGVSAYMGTLLVEVPVGAKGTYTIDFTNSTEETFSADGDAKSYSIIAANSHPAFIVIPCVPGTDCEDCDACTTDVVNGDLSCSNTPNYNTGVECCDPASGTITTIDDVNDCTRDACNSTTGTVTHNSLPNDTLCGGIPVGACDDQNKCNFTGTCVAKFASPGTPCGDSSTTDCSNPDSCDADGLCLDNHVPDGVACDDGMFCTLSDMCASGMCDGNARDCSDNIPCTADSCNEGLSACVNSETNCVCTTIAISNPASCSIDARIPHLRTNSASLLGWDSIDLDFNIGCSCNSINVGDLSVSDVPGSPDSDVISGQAVIAGITGGFGNLCTVVFAAPIPSNQWTCVTVKFNGEQRCIGSLPSDVDGDQFSTSNDVTILTAHLALATGLMNEVDINRDGEATSLDVIATLNLLTGADQFSTWLDAGITQTCP